MPLGMVRVDGDLDSETGEALLTALGAVLDAETRSRAGQDDRTSAQRRADALGEICRQWLDRSDRPMIGGERPHVTLTVDAGMLAGRAAGMAELDRTGAVPEEIAKRHLCDASVMRVALSGRSQPMDVGRRTPIVPPAMRRAVIVRDRGCRFPGCDRLHSWCDAHHIVHWADGGPRVQVGAARWPPGIHATGRIVVGRPSAAVTWSGRSGRPHAPIGRSSSTRPPSRRIRRGARVATRSS